MTKFGHALGTNAVFVFVDCVQILWDIIRMPKKLKAREFLGYQGYSYSYLGILCEQTSQGMSFSSSMDAARTGGGTLLFLH